MVGAPGEQFGLCVDLYVNYNNLDGSRIERDGSAHRASEGRGKANQ